MADDWDSQTDLFILHNEISPYRLPLFERLSQLYNLEVNFVHKKSTGRRWDSSLNDYKFSYTVGSDYSIGGVFLNPELVLRLIRRPFDIYLIGSVDIATSLSVFITLITAKIRQKPLIFWAEFVDTEYHAKNKPLENWLGDRYRKLLASEADVCIAFSSMTKQHLVSLGIEEDKIIQTVQAFPFGLLADEVACSETSSETIILSFGYLDERKGIDILIKAFKNLDPNHAKLIIAGQGDAMEDLKQLATDENIEFVGYVTDEEKPRYFSEADIFVLPTHHDPWGLVTNEAMYYGTPIIITENAGSKELVEDNGIVIKPGSVTALENALHELIDDEEKRRRMGRRSTEIIQEYDTSRMISDFQKAIEYVRAHICDTK